MKKAEPTWVATVNRLLKAEPRPDPRDPTQMKYWKQVDLALAAGVRQNTITELMRDGGKDGPKFETLRAVAEALKIPVFYLLMTEEEARTYMQGADVASTTQDREAIRNDVVAALAPQIEHAIQAITTEHSKRRKR